MGRARGYPFRLVWGDALDQIIDHAYPLDEANAYSLPRPDYENVQAASGVEEAWFPGHDQLLKGTVRWIPQDGSLYNSVIGRRLSGWEEANGWAAYLRWARNKGVAQLYPDFRNMALSPSLGSDSNADGVVDGWAVSKPANVTGATTFDAVNLAQVFSVTNSTTTGLIYRIEQFVPGIVVGETLRFSAEAMVDAPIVNGDARLAIQAVDGGNNYLGTSTNASITATAWGTRVVTAAYVVPAGAVSVCIRAQISTLAAGTVGTARFRKVVLERSSIPVGATQFIDQPGARSVYLIDPLTDPPESESDFLRRVACTWRDANGLPFTGF